VHAPVDGPTLLELLHEAGDEAVTLAELEIVGIPEPARALLELELAGLKLQRVYEHESRQICVRLAPEGGPEIDILGNELVEPPEYEPTVTRVEPLREALVPEPEAEVIDAEVVAEQPTVEIVLPPPAPAAVRAAPSRSSRPLVLGALAAFFALFLLSRR
jgi:hypothetical protein